MTASATAPTREKAERAREDCEYVRSLLNARQPRVRRYARIGGTQARARSRNGLRVVTKE